MGAYWKGALIRGGRLFQISKNVLNRKIKKAIDRFILNAIRRHIINIYSKLSISEKPITF